MHIHKDMVLTTYLNSKFIQFHTHQHIKIIETKINEIENKHKSIKSSNLVAAKMKSKSNKHKHEKEKKIEMSEGERNLPVRGRKATERELVARDAAERERESHACALRGRERESWWCAEREIALLRRKRERELVVCFYGRRNFNFFFFW